MNTITLIHKNWKRFITLPNVPRINEQIELKIDSEYKTFIITDVKYVINDHDNFAYTDLTVVED